MTGTGETGCNPEADALHLLLESIPDQAVCLLDPEGRIAGWNGGATRLKGYTAEEVLGRPLRFFHLPEENETEFQGALLSRALREGRAEARGWCLRRDGSRFWSHAILTPVHDAAGRHAGFVQVTRDLTEARARDEALRISEERFRCAMRHGVAGMAVLSLDGTFLEVNPAACELLGRKMEALCAMPLRQLLHPDDWPHCRAGVDALMRGEDENFRTEGRCLRPRGGAIRAHLSVSLVRKLDGTPQHFLAQFREVTSPAPREAAEQNEQDRLRVTLCAIADGVVSIDAAGGIDFMNPAAEAITGCRLENVAGAPVEVLFAALGEDERAALRQGVRGALAGRSVPVEDRPLALMGWHGRRVEVQEAIAPLLGRDGSILGAVIVLQDVSSMRSMQKELEFSALHDALTGLPNRSKFETVLAGAVDSTRAGDAEHALCFLDLDRFKIVNDTAGHAAGDTLLRLVARTLCRAVRPTDMVARLGDDEFAIILFDCPVAQAKEILRPVLKAVGSLPFLWEGRTYHVTASIGVAAVNAGLETYNAAMKHADIACDAAKHGGRNRISVYDLEDEAGGARHREIIMATEIRDALCEGRFRLHAQRIEAMRPGPRQHYELLLRMVGRDGGLISPALFIPVAERYDLMAEIDRWVLTEVLRHQAPALAAAGNISVAVNISAQSLNDPCFLPFFLKLLKLSRLPPELITLEITETALISNLLAAGAILDNIRRLGCRIALDDFGAGLSSFGYLRAFRVDAIKIDGTFIRNLHGSPIDLAIVKSITRIAREIGAETVAEFVEDRQVLEYLREIGVDAAQGYAIAAPVELDMLLARPHQAA